MSPSRWAPIEEMIREFQGLLVPPLPLKIENGLDCAESCPTFRAASPSLKKQGVYMVFDDSESKIYVGVTIDRPLVDRCRDHIKNKRFKLLGFTPRWIDVIPFDPEWEFLAPSLELYLIYKIFHQEHGCTLTLVNKRGTMRAHFEIVALAVADLLPAQE